MKTKTGVLCRVLCGLLMILFLGSSDESCDQTTETSQLVVNNNTGTGFTATVYGMNQYVGDSDAVSFNVPPDAYYTVTTSTGLSKQVYVGYSRSSVSFP